ncbi:hypothetical protein D3C81_1787710 [compost metagenome]
MYISVRYLFDILLECFLILEESYLWVLHIVGGINRRFRLSLWLSILIARLLLFWSIRLVFWGLWSFLSLWLYKSLSFLLGYMLNPLQFIVSDILKQGSLCSRICILLLQQRLYLFSSLQYCNFTIHLSYHKFLSH